MEDTAAISRDDLYNYNDAARIVGVAKGTIIDGVRTKRLTKVVFPGDPHAYVLKVEIDAIAGMGEVGLSKEAKARLAAVRKDRNYMQEEMGYGDPVQWYAKPENAEAAVRSDPSTFLTILERLFGGTIHLERRATGGGH
jgi:hypothetical protein